MLFRSLSSILYLNMEGDDRIISQSLYFFNSFVVVSYIIYMTRQDNDGFIKTFSGRDSDNFEMNQHVAGTDKEYDEDLADCNTETESGKAKDLLNYTKESQNYNENNMFVIVDPDTELDKESENKFKLLVIDDSKDIRSYLNTIFRYEYNVILAENGKDGFNLALRELPDLIITDIKMPVMDGMEFCRLLKGNINTYHLPVILLSAMDEEGDIVRGIELGADDYILKPFNYKILKSKVRNLINSRNELRHKYSQIFTEDKQEEEKAPQKEMFEEEPFIKNIINIITENIQNEDFSVKKLSEILNMSQPTLYRRIKQHTNFTIIELIRYVRLKKSSELLKEKSYSVQEVALMVGYNDVPTFRKHFIDFYGITPSNFMKDTVEQ